MPVNPLTNILKDFRKYRPDHHNEWLTFVEKEAARVGVRKFALENDESALLLMANFD